MPAAKHFPACADVWNLRGHWVAQRSRLQSEITQGTVRLGPLSIVTPALGEPLHLWDARDALILKALTLALTPRLALSPRCVHVKGHGGLKAAVRGVQQQLHGNQYVLRTDVKGFYESIDQPTLLAQLAHQVHDPGLLELLRQAIERSLERGGLWRDIRQGISRGCPLSPLLGALYLKVLDDRLTRTGLYYVRYMDDIVVLTRTHGQLRRAVRVLNRSFNQLKLSQAPDKTFIGRIARGFDFLGYHFDGGNERDQRTPNGASLLGPYVRRWWGWVISGLVVARDMKKPAAAGLFSWPLDGLRGS